MKKMSQTETNVSIVFRRILEALNSLSGEEINNLSDPLYSVEVRVVRRQSKEELTLFSADINVEDAINEVSVLATRQEAQALLDEKYLSRKALEPIARKLDIPIMRQDKVEVLRDKIIEATVGARIRSQAIQGT